MLNYFERQRASRTAASWAWIALFLAGGFSARAAAAEEAAPKIDFIRDIRPILSKNCFACHGPDDKHREAQLRLDTEAGAFAESDGRRPFTPGKPDASEAYLRVASTDELERMPPAEAGNPLSKEQIALLKAWIEQGAKWGTHWSFTKIERPALPDVKRQSWPSNEIDAFVLHRLEQERLAPSPEADRSTLIRRVAVDLTGLPPTLEEVDAFLKDTRPDAYERLVDRLLESPAYGERWASVWLDLARYADTKGYEKDRMRTIWRYRDWVIDAFNRDLPFDQFTREQLAGDLLPDATRDQILATAFHRNTMSNDEGGTDDEEFRIAAVKDRIDTTAQVWMGLTLGCAKCHSHKYDPLTNREYYQFYAFFNQTEDSDRFDEQPLVAMPTAAQEAQLERLNGELAQAKQQLQEQLRQPIPELKADLAKWEATLAAVKGWVPLKPAAMEAASGSNLKLLDDGSILAGPEMPPTETYRLTFPTDLARITGIRLEVLPDPAHPKGGTGRAKDDGNFVLSRITAALKPANGESTAVPFSQAEADFAQANYPVADAIKNDDPKKHGWAVSPQQSKPHTAVFVAAAPAQAGAGSELTVQLEHLFEFTYPGFSIGRFRISATSDENPSLKPAVPDAILAIVRTPAAQRTPAQQQQLLEHYGTISPLTKSTRDQIALLSEQIKAVNPPQTPILRELPAEKQRKTRIHVRGNFLDPGDEVQAAVPAAFPPLPAGVPASRLGVAEWLIDPQNPLTARVLANRFWARFFGIGIVETEEDFGSQGTLPSHPELLDWLASDFRRQQWSMKALCKTIVMSATYRQSSRATPELLQLDRRNRLLARGPRFRLDAEMVRDHALAVSGLLSPTMHGPSVMPPQPDGIWKSTYNTDKWVTSPAGDKYRRGLYTFIKRTSPYPSMITFDAPSREVCTVRRISTNTPLQALVTLNDPVYIEAAQALARRLVKEAGPTEVDRITHGFRLAVARPPNPREIEQLQALYQRRLKHYRAAPDAAQQMASDPLGPLPEGGNAAELAAWTTVCNVLLNLDEFLTRG